MKERTRLIITVMVGLSAVGLFACPSVQGQAIGIDFSDSQVSVMAAGETAGAPGFVQANWNSPTAGASGTAANLNDDAGAATTASVSWTCANTWRLYSGNTMPGNYRLMNGYLDTNNTSTTAVTVSGIPYPTYDIVIYLDGGNGGDWRVARYRLVDPADSSIIAGPFYGRDNENVNFSDSFVQIPSTSVTDQGINTPMGNYMVIKGLTDATFRLEVTPGTGEGSTLRAPINGIQIVLSGHVPSEPAPANGERAVSLEPTLSWQPPNAMYSPNPRFLVWFGADPNVAHNPSYDVGPATGYLPNALDYDTTYYWRVDTVDPNEDGGTMVRPGKLWSFTTEQHPSQIGRGVTGLHVPAEGLTVRNPSFENVGDAGSNYGYDVLDWYEEGDNQSNSGARAFWEIGTSIGLPNCDGTRWAGLYEGTAYYQDIGVVTPGQNYVVNVLVGIRSGYGTPETARVTASLYCGGSAADARDGVRLGGFATLIDSFTAIPAESEAVSAREFIVRAPLSAGNAPAGQTLWLHVKATTGRVYVDDVEVEKGCQSNCAWNPSPARGELDVSTTASVLTWNTGVNIDNDYQTDASIVAHRVYVGTDRNAVIAADTSDTGGIYRGRLGVGTTVYDPVTDQRPLPSDSRIYWRVDEELNGGGIVRGEIWSFDTELLLATILEQSVGSVVDAGQPATLSVLVDTATPESYQWFKVVDGAGQAISGETASQLVIPGAGLADEGLYYCRIHNNAGDVFTDNMFLVIKRQMGHWTFDGTLASAIDPAHTGAVGVSHYVTGISGQAWEFTVDPNVIVVDNSADDFNFYPQGYTFSAWINTTEADWGALVAKQHRVSGEPMVGVVMAHSGANAGSMVRGLFGGDIMSANVTVNDGAWHHVAATYDAVNGIGRIYVDGRLNNTSIVDMNRPATVEEPLIFGAETVAGDVAPYVGLLDDVQIWNYALNPYEVGAVYVAIRTDDAFCVEIDPMDFDGNCRVDLADFAAFAAKWMDCNWVPAEMCVQ